MEKIELGDLTVDLDRKEVEIGGMPIALTHQQWRLLECLALAGGLVTRELLAAVLHASAAQKPNIRSVDALACNLRRKLARASGGRNYIRPVRHCGYVLSKAA